MPFGYRSITLSEGRCAGVAMTVPVAALHIMVVDDDQEYAHLVENILVRLGHRVSTHLDPNLALAALAAPTPAPDLLITDFHMPGTDGLALVRAARACHPDLTCVVITSDVEGVDAADAAAAGVRMTLEKPQSMARFAELIRRATA